MPIKFRNSFLLLSYSVHVLFHQVISKMISINFLNFIYFICVVGNGAQSLLYNGQTLIVELQPQPEGGSFK